MDTFAFHPYLETSKLAPTFSHPLSRVIALNDYGKLVTQSINLGICLRGCLHAVMERHCQDIRE